MRSATSSSGDSAWLAASQSLTVIVPVRTLRHDLQNGSVLLQEPHARESVAQLPQHRLYKMRDARGDAGLTDETRFVKGRAGGGVLRQALSLKLSNDQSKKSGSPEGPTLNRRSSENDRYEMKFGPIWRPAALQ